MVHVCDRCGAEVEDGVSFCNACGAPQIRVNLPTPPAATAPPQPVIFNPPQYPASRDIVWHDGVRAAAIAGLIAGLLSLVIPGFGLGMALWMLGGGALAVAIYRRRRPLDRTTAGTGARLGSVAALFAFVVFGFVTVLELTLGGPESREAMRRAIEESARRNPDPQIQEMMQRFLSPAGMALVVTLGFVFVLIMFLVLGSIGGAVWAAMQPRDDR